MHGRKWAIGSIKMQMQMQATWVNVIAFYLSGICGDIPPKVENKPLHLASYITRLEA